MSLFATDVTSSDVTDARLALTNALDLFELVTRTANDVLYDAHATGELRWRGAITPLLGYAEDAIEPTVAFWKTLIHPDDLPRVTSSLEAALVGTVDHWSGTYRLRRQDGSWATVLDRASIVRDAAGAGSRRIGWLIDLSERTSLGEQLAELQHRYSSLFDQSLDAIVFTRPDGSVIDANPAALRMFGVTRGLLQKFRVADAYVNLADRDTVMVAMLTSGVIENFQVRLRRASGETFLASYSGTVCRRGADVGGFIGVIRDVTESTRMQDELRERVTALHEAQAALQQSEAKFRAIIENSNEVVALLDGRGIVRYVTPSVRNMDAHPDGVVGFDLSVFIAPEDWPRVREAMTRAAQAPGGREAVAAYRAIAPGGRVVWCEATFTNMLDHPAIAALVVHARDVTERVEAEAARNRAEEQFRQAQKLEAIGRLAGGVAHDFNNLLTAITGSAELALEGTSNEELRRDIETIRTAAFKAAAITRQLLAFGRKQMTSPRVIGVSEAVQGFEPLLRRLVRPEVSLELALECAGAIEIDPIQLEQAILNLVVNANDAMPAGGHLTVSTRSVGNRAVIEVRDTGVGIEDRIRARIFEPFFTTKAPGQGTGLGLATVYGIVAQAGGAVEVDSAPGRGSTFRLVFPMAMVENIQAPETAFPPETLTGTETVLLVDDEASVRLPVARALGRLGYTVIEAKHGRDALTLLEERGGPADVVITDLVMPEMGGAELIAELRARWPSQRVIVVSGYSQDVARARGAAQDAPFLQKPFTMLALSRAVREVLDRGIESLPRVA